MDYRQLLNIQFWQRVSSGDWLSTRFFINVLDILVVWFLVYQLIQLVKGTKAVQLIKGVVVFFVIRVLAEIIGLKTVTWLMDQVITYGVIAGVVIFQPEIRRALESLGRGANLKSKQADATEWMIQGYEKAIRYMSKRKIGALITIQKEMDLQAFIETGLVLEADITGELLINIFIPNTPLHDGAVIVRDNKVAVACAYLPLTENPNIPKEYGTRHRAAIGISEVSDAFTIVVSEETGEISVTKNGRFLPHLTMEEFGRMLREELAIKEESKQNNLFRTVEHLFSRRKGGDES